MTKKITRSELIRLVNNLEPIEIIIESIQRDDSNSNKRTKLQSFVKAAQCHIDDQRDVYVVSIKVK